MLRRTMMVAAALALHCGGGQSGTEDDSPYVESPFDIVTAAGEHLAYSDGHVHVSHRAPPPAQVELSVSGRDASDAAWGFVFYAEADGVLGEYEAVVTTGPTGVGAATVSRMLGGDGAQPLSVVFGTSGAVRAEIRSGANGIEMHGDVDSPELTFSFGGPLLFSCSVPHELLPNSPAPLVPDDPTVSPGLIGDTNLETEFCRGFMGAPRAATP